MPPPLSERLSAACAELDLVLQLLLSPTPQQLDQSAAHLTAATTLLTACRDAAHHSSASERIRAQEPVRRLGHSLKRARDLLESAAAFHAGWIQLLGTCCAGYTGQGTPAAVQHASRLFARG